VLPKNHGTNEAADQLVGGAASMTFGSSITGGCSIIGSCTIIVGCYITGGTGVGVDEGASCVVMTSLLMHSWYIMYHALGNGSMVDKSTVKIVASSSILANATLLDSFIGLRIMAWAFDFAALTFYFANFNFACCVSLL
jgi:hypothetical protein